MADSQNLKGKVGPGRHLRRGEKSAMPMRVMGVPGTACWPPSLACGGKPVGRHRALCPGNFHRQKTRMPIAFRYS